MICNPSCRLGTSRTVSVEERVLTESKSARRRRKNEGKGDRNKGGKNRKRREERMKKEILHRGERKEERLIYHETLEVLPVQQRRPRVKFPPSDVSR